MTCTLKNECAKLVKKRFTRENIVFNSIFVDNFWQIMLKILTFDKKNTEYPSLDIRYSIII